VIVTIASQNASLAFVSVGLLALEQQRHDHVSQLGSTQQLERAEALRTARKSLERLK
jgi:hypothetical protein